MNLLYLSIFKQNYFVDIRIHKLQIVNNKLNSSISCDISLPYIHIFDYTIMYINYFKTTPSIIQKVKLTFFLPKKVIKFIEISKNMSKGYKTNNILVTMGEDFQYQDAAMWFINLDKLIQ